MAEHKIQGGDYLLKINDDTVVCLTSVSLNDSVTVVDASSACGPDKSPGSLEISITFEGQHLQDPDSGNISGTDLRTLLRSESTISFEIGPIIPRIGDEIQTGTGFISELSSSYAFDAVGTFTGTIQCYGIPSMDVFDVYIGQPLADGYVCYIEENEEYCLVAKDVEVAESWGNDVILTGAQNTTLLSGIINTNIIINDYDGAPSAALTIQSLGVGWFMPCTQDVALGIIANYDQMPFIGLDYNAAIWTSTEYDVDPTQAYAYDFNVDNGTIITSALNTYAKTVTHRLIAYKKINL
jgi:hypothetical protein